MSNRSRHPPPAARAAGAAAPVDQADGLRRLFGARSTRCVPLVANPHVAGCAVAIERLAAAFGALQRHVLVVDAADTSPAAAEAVTLGLACCVEPVSARLSYLAARGLPRRFVDSRGCAAALLDNVQAAAPRADLLLVHAEAVDLVRMFKGRPGRPVLLAADHPESITHAYACWKLLARRCGWLSADLLLLASQASPRLDPIAASLSQCADEFFGAVLTGWAAIDPVAAQRESVDDALHDVAAAQLRYDETVVTGLPAQAGLPSDDRRSARSGR
jgi:flagellar biosynthesis protein FlhG